MSGGGWSCPHETNGLCDKFDKQPCDPGMKGCELYGRYVFFDGSKNERIKQKQARSPLITTDNEAPSTLKSTATDRAMDD